jgi:glucosamine 6-phosphate synthetase-like amidotransferase/phosphosugar isomerase protein
MRGIAGYKGNGKGLPLLIGQICTLQENGQETRPLSTGGCLAARDRQFESGRHVSMPEKAGYDHCLLKDIYEQPEAVLRTLGKRSEDTGRLLHELGMVNTARNLRRLHIVGCGSSYHAALAGRYIIERFVHIPVGIDIASEYRCMESIVTKGTLFISISQSGETADTLEAQREAKRKGAFTVTICNEKDSACAREADAVLYTSAGLETGAIPTKTFTTQMAALCLLGIALGIGKERVNPVEAETLRSLLTGLPCLMKKALGTGGMIREISRTLVHAKGCLYLGRGINYPIALEGALKMKKLCHIPAEGFAAGEMRGRSRRSYRDGSASCPSGPRRQSSRKALFRYRGGEGQRWQGYSDNRRSRGAERRRRPSCPCPFDPSGLLPVRKRHPSSASRLSSGRA